MRLGTAVMALASAQLTEVLTWHRSVLVPVLTFCACIKVYTQGLLLPLPYPDFSMPYNVTCFTSTLLAIYLGSILTLLLHRPRVAAEAALASRSQSKFKKAAKGLSLFVVFGGLILYLDKDAQRAVGALLGVDLEQLLSE